MRLVERHIIAYDQHLDNLCWLSKNLYNVILHHVRQTFFSTGKMPSEYELSSKLAEGDQLDFRCLPSQTSQQLINQVFKSFKSYFRALRDWRKNPWKYQSCPKMPNYKEKENGQNILIFTNQNTSLKDGYIHFPKSVKLKPLKTNIDSYKQVRLIPQATCYIMEVVYEKEVVETRDLNPNLYLSCDLGVNNLVTMVDNNGNALIVNGRVVKRINQWYNKFKAKLQSYVAPRKTSNRIDHLIHRRNCMIEDALHKTSRFIVDYCLEHKIKTIVIGHNQEWKQNANIGNKNNQNFTSIPHSKLIDKINYKAKLVGIDVKITEEAHTSKCDALAYEVVGHHDEYLGKRVKRGLFQSSIGKLINADVNGALNILRKAVGDSCLRILDVSRVLRPIRVETF